MLFTITKPPIGIQFSRSGLEIILGLNVEAEKVDDKMVVKKATLVEKIKAKGGEVADLWAKAWNGTAVDSFNFSA
ncbi:MAG: hypothetical protein ABL927_06190 [Bdellovibrionales bacterium]